MVAGLAGAVELGAFVLVGLLGGAHCLGMCGPLVTAYAGPSTDDGGRVTLHDVRQQGLLTFGRVGTYALVGAGLGALGGAAVSGGSLFAGADLVRGVAGVVAGVVVVVVGAGYLRGRPLDPGSVPIPGVSTAFARIARVAGERADEWADGPRIALLGSVHALLPCPLLYPAYLYAFARGSPAAGALALGALGVGTAPAMVGYATVIGSVPASVRGRVHRALGGAFVILGLLPLLHGLGLLGVPVPMVHLPQYAEVPAP
ncbi:sulfite exporter TauE/SafE family protein [Halobaculum lipolyticum]|uniref:Sulfite exporter TauE/SafE family protein n=1 Tax=Halobaculum lipolyticum TaxID=3032001 RepID=A0ABD5W8H3_9EURY|nr:sulfite exporter TauE/SafE family protein [Halobaculum sp. DT31]